MAEDKAAEVDSKLPIDQQQTINLKRLRNVGCGRELRHSNRRWGVANGI